MGLEGELRNRNKQKNPSGQGKLPLSTEKNWGRNSLWWWGICSSWQLGRGAGASLVALVAAVGGSCAAG